MARSWLFVPGDSERKLAKTEAVAADALILDLEDAVAVARRDTARRLVGEFLSSRRDAPGPVLWVRINPLDTDAARADLAAVCPARPAGIVLPKASPAGVLALAAELDQLESAHGLRAGAIGIIPIATETAGSLFDLKDYAGSGPRLAALTWGAEDLSTALGVTRNTDAEGDWTFTFKLARSACVLAAHAAGVPALDTVYTAFKDIEGLERTARLARADGFSGKLAIHPTQVEAINQAFQPSAGEIEAARRVVAAFATADATGVVSLDGRMLDRPHLAQAERILSAAASDGD